MPVPVSSFNKTSPPLNIAGMNISWARVGYTTFGYARESPSTRGFLNPSFSHLAFPSSFFGSSSTLPGAEVLKFRRLLHVLMAWHPGRARNNTVAEVYGVDGQTTFNAVEGERKCIRRHVFASSLNQSDPMEVGGRRGTEKSLLPLSEIFCRIHKYNRWTKKDILMVYQTNAFVKVQASHPDLNSTVMSHKDDIY